MIYLLLSTYPTSEEIIDLNAPTGNFDWAETQQIMTFEDADRALKAAGYSQGYSKVVIGGWDLARTPLSYCFVGVLVGSQRVVNVDVMVRSGVVRQVERCENET